MNASHKPKIIIAQLGARRHYAEAEILQEFGFLERLFTDIYIGNKPIIEYLLKLTLRANQSGLIKKILGRNNETLPPKKVTSFDLLGLWYVNAIRTANRPGKLEIVYSEVAKRFFEKIYQSNLLSCDILVGFNGASYDLFKYAKNKGIYCILDQTSNPKALEIKLTEEQFDIWRDWVPFGGGYIPEDLLKKAEYHEWQVADLITVGSTFVANGLIECGVPPEKINVIPSGVDLTKFNVPSREKFDGKRPIRVLFVGRVSIMKGVPYLLNALKLLGSNRVEARFIGEISICLEKLETFADVAYFLGKIPRSDIVKHYAWADVFCFPSITEGSASVTYEALATGLPVITTVNSGSLVNHGFDGYIIDIKNVASIKNALNHYFNNPNDLSQHQINAANARDKVGLNRYRHDLIKNYNKIIKKGICGELEVEAE